MSFVNKNMVIVLGVQRSGTSAITKSLSSVNASFGCNLLEEHKKVNPTGFWEDSDILLLNEKILMHLDLTWSSLRPIRLTDFSENDLEEFYKDATALLMSKMSDNKLFALKEPRITKLFVFWDYVIKKNKINCKYIIALRDPNDVANSFKRLENTMVSAIETKKQYVYKLWISYLISVVSVFDEPSDIYIIEYERILENPKDIIEHMAGKFDYDINDDELNEYCNTFINRSLNHSDNEKVINFSDRLVNDFYDLLRDISNNNSNLTCSMSKRLNKIKEEFECNIEMLTLVDQVNYINKKNKDAHAKSSELKNKEIILLKKDVITLQNNVTDKANELEKITVRNEFLMTEICKFTNVK